MYYSAHTMVLDVVSLWLFITSLKFEHNFNDVCVFNIELDFFVILYCISFLGLLPKQKLYKPKRLQNNSQCLYSSSKCFPTLVITVPIMPYIYCSPVGYCNAIFNDSQKAVRNCFRIFFKVDLPAFPMLINVLWKIILHIFTAYGAILRQKQGRRVINVITCVVYIVEIVIAYNLWPINYGGTAVD